MGYKSRSDHDNWNGPWNWELDGIGYTKIRNERRKQERRRARRREKLELARELERQLD